MTDYKTANALAHIVAALDASHLTPEQTSAGREIARRIRAGLRSNGVELTPEVLVALAAGAGIQATLAAADAVRSVGGHVLADQVPPHSAIGLAVALLARDSLG